MKSHSGDLAWGIKVGLLGVLAFMTWPILGEIVAGSALVAEMNTHRIALAEAGSAWTRFGAHGSGQGQFARPAAAAFLQSGQLVILDSGNCRVVALDDIGGAGWTAYGHRGRPTPGDPAVGAFADPRGLAVDTADRIWVSDPGAQPPA